MDSAVGYVYYPRELEHAQILVQEWANIYGDRAPDLQVELAAGENYTLVRTGKNIPPQLFAFLVNFLVYDKPGERTDATGWLPILDAATMLPAEWIGKQAMFYVAAEDKLGDNVNVVLPDAPSYFWDFGRNSQLVTTGLPFAPLSVNPEEHTFEITIVPDPEHDDHDLEFTWWMKVGVAAAVVFVILAVVLSQEA